MAANDRQVGGAHYRRRVQHWDLMARLKADYFAGQVTKYTERAPRKNGSEDLEKALHFAEKRAEVLGETSVSPLVVAEGLRQFDGDIRMYAIEAGLSALEHRIFEYALLRPDAPEALVSLCQLNLAQSKADSPVIRPAPKERPGTPEDGGQHAAASEEDMSELEDAIRRMGLIPSVD